MRGYRLASYCADQGVRAGAVVGDVLYDVAVLTSNPAYNTVANILDDWDAAHAAIAAAAVSPGCKGVAVGSVTLRAPVPRPGAIYCVGANYSDHAEEMRLAANRPPQPDPRAMGLKPFFFIKSSHAVADPGAIVNVNGYTRKLDWEIELAAVIGRKAQHLSVEDALSCVAGYTVSNDLSARDQSARSNVPTESLFRADWLRHKSFDNSAPMGPWITPAAYIDDPADLVMQLWVNGTLKQNSHSGKMIFSIAEQIAHLTTGITLYPGDIIMTGTPAGVGAGKNEFLGSGDVVKMSIAEIGDMTFSVAYVPGAVQ